MDNSKAFITAAVAAVVAVLAVVALIFTTYRNSGNEPEAASTPTVRITGTPAPAGPISGSPTGSATRPAEPTDEGDDHEADTLDANAKAAVLDTTVKFIDAWRNPGTPPQRMTAIRPYATEHLTSLLANVPAENLPSGDIKGEPIIESPTQYAAATITTLSTGKKVRCNLVYDGTGWKVSEILPVEPGASPSASVTPTGSDAEGGSAQDGSDGQAGQAGPGRR